MPSVSSDGSHVWALNYAGGVTELDAATGALTRVLAAARYRFLCPDGITIGGGSV